MSAKVPFHRQAEDPRAFRPRGLGIGTRRRNTEGIAGLSFVILDRIIRIQWDEGEPTPSPTAVFGGFAASDPARAPDVAYRLAARDADGHCAVFRNEQLLCHQLELGQCLFAIQQDLIVSLQRLRPDLLFLHSAVLARDGKAYLFAAPSGKGKSTLCWAMLHHGFRLMSDELAPITADSAHAIPFPLAVSLKSTPPAPYPLPPGTVSTQRAYYVPIFGLPTPPQPEPLPLAAIVFVEYKTTNLYPVFRELSKAQAVTHLYPNILNALAHDSAGIDRAISLVHSTRCFHLASAGLDGTAAEAATLLSQI